MNNIMPAIVIGLVSFMTGGLLFYLINTHNESKGKLLSSRNDELKQVYHPLEILVRINAQEFEKYFRDDATNEEREFIEKYIWHPNYRQIQRIIMNRSNVLAEIPDELLRLLNYVNLWLAEYELVYTKNLKEPPVFVRPNGLNYPGESDEYILQRSNELRRVLRK